MIDTLNQDWVRTAYSKGLSRRRVIPVHVLRNSLIPVITNTATNFGVLLVGFAYLWRFGYLDWVRSAATTSVRATYRRGLDLRQEARIDRPA